MSFINESKLATNRKGHRLYTAIFDRALAPNEAGFAVEQIKYTGAFSEDYLEGIARDLTLKNVEAVKVTHEKLFSYIIASDSQQWDGVLGKDVQTLMENGLFCGMQQNLGNANVTFLSESYYDREKTQRASRIAVPSPNNGRDFEVFEERFLTDGRFYHGLAKFYMIADDGASCLQTTINRIKCDEREVTEIKVFDEHGVQITLPELTVSQRTYFKGVRELPSLDDEEMRTLSHAALQRPMPSGAGDLLQAIRSRMGRAGR